MNIREGQSARKLRGGYYTPSDIADFMVSWTLNDNTDGSVLEPSAGDGVFVQSLLQHESKGKIVAVELLQEEAEKISQIIDERGNCVVFNEDFYDYYERFRENDGDKYDAVVGNPPYIRYQYLTEEQRNYQSDILVNNGIKPNKLINAWMAFTVAAIEMLKNNGRIAFVLPTDLLQVSYAKQLRQFLFDNLSKLTVVTFQSLVFDDIQQDVVLLMGEKKTCVEDEVHFLRVLNVKNSSDLDKSLFNEPFDQYNQYDSDKWTKFYLSRSDRNYYEIDFQNKTDSFNDFAKGEVGITTGNNNFFAVSEDTVQQFSLSNYIRPLLGRSIEVKGIFYTENDLRMNIISGKNIWLLDFNGQKLSDSAQSYIDYGVQTEQNTGYKLRIRKRWYDVPSIWTPQAFLLRRIGEYPRIVKNEIEATSTDTFHRIKFLDGTNISKFIFLCYSSVTLLTFELEGRVFGGGALEILPGDLKNIRIPIVDNNLNYDELLLELDMRFRKGQKIHEIVKWVNSVISEHTILSDEELNRTFQMWQFLNLNRMT
ncbi:MAG: Eco57I restriction-modification methylase domain-containing protein [Culicoidibacterales bacterium]